MRKGASMECLRRLGVDNVFALANLGPAQCLSRREPGMTASRSPRIRLGDGRGD